MFGIDSSGFIIIMIVALIVIGPQRLPEIMAKVGKFMGQMRRMTTDVKRSFEVEFERVEQEKKKLEAMKELFPEDFEANRTGVSEASAQAPAQPAPEPGAAPQPTVQAEAWAEAASADAACAPPVATGAPQAPPLPPIQDKPKDVA